MLTYSKSTTRSLTTHPHSYQPQVSYHSHHPPPPPQPTFRINITALQPTNYDHVVVAYNTGRLELYSSLALLTAAIDIPTTEILSVTCPSTDIWVGLADGTILGYGQGLVPKMEIKAHEEPVVGLAVAGRRVYSLGKDGTVRGWFGGVPGAGDQRCWELW